MDDTSDSGCSDCFQSVGMGCGHCKQWVDPLSPRSSPCQCSLFIIAAGFRADRSASGEWLIKDLRSIGEGTTQQVS